MKIRKTYGINGLLEWHGVVVSHGVKMKVDFTNGGCTAWGVNPASFTTTDELTQHIIENSEQFKSGRIRLVKSTELPGGDDLPAQQERDIMPTPTTPTTEVSNDGTPLVERVSNKIDAIEYLKEHFPDKNYTSIGLRTKTAFETACKECNVTFVYTND